MFRQRNSLRRRAELASLKLPVNRPEILWRLSAAAAWRRNRMERPMRSTIAIAVVSIVVAATLPVVAQQPAPPAQPAPIQPAPVQPAPVPPAPPAQVAPPVQAAPAPAPTTPAAQPKTTARTARASRRRTGHVVRHRRESICSIVNGWRAFNNPYDPKGYFYTGRVCCCG